jgi:hypothetical protein
LIQFDGEQYLTVADVARHLHISRGTCYNNLLPQMQKCYLPGRKHAFYRQTEVAQLAGIRLESKQNTSPTSTATEDAGDAVASHHESVKVVWQGQYSPLASQMQEAEAIAERVTP